MRLTHVAVALSLLAPAVSAIRAQMPKFEVGLFGGASSFSSAGAGMASRYDSIGSAAHVGGELWLRLLGPLALRAGVRRQSHGIPPTPVSTTTGTITFSGDAVFFSTFAGPSLSIGILPKLSASAFASVSRVYDQSRLRCQGSAGPVFCADANSDESGYEFGTALQYRWKEYKVFGEIRREAFKNEQAGKTFNFNAVSLGIGRAIN